MMSKHTQAHNGSAFGTFDMPIYQVPVNMLTPKLLHGINNVLRTTWPCKSMALNHDAYEWVVLAQNHGKIIGVLFTRRGKDNWTYIEKLAVLPEFRRRGVGRSLLEYTHCEIDTDQTQVLHVDAGPDHDRLLNYYMRHHFELLYTNKEESMLRRDARH